MMKILSIVIVLFLLIQSNKAGHHQKKLLEKLFKDYDPLERPVADDNETLTVKLGLAIQQIVDVDEKKQTLVFSGWLDMVWTDYSLTWNPEEYGNITSLRVSSTRIWIPDLILYNSADDTFDVISKVNVVISHTGSIKFMPPGMFKSTCPIKIDDFPFDEQNCSLKFGSWTYDEDNLKLVNDSDRAQLDSYIKNGEWYLQGVSSYSESIKYECCHERFPFVMFVLSMRRRTLYFLFNLIIPCVLISFMSLLGFSLPPESGEKMGLEVTVLLSIIMFSQIINSIIPESSLSIPKIALYFACVMGISSASIIANVAVLIFHHRNVKIQKPMPRWVEIIVCNFLATLLGMRIPDRDKEKRQSKPKKKQMIMNHVMSSHHHHGEANELSSKSLLANVLDINDDFIGNKYAANNISSKNQLHLSNRSGGGIKSSSVKYNNSPGSQNDPTYSPYNNSSTQAYLKRENSSLSQSGLYDGMGGSGDGAAALFGGSSNNKNDIISVRKSLAGILKEVKAITTKIKEDEEDESKELSWKFAAMVIDRLCFVTFSILTIISTGSILMTSKNFYKSSDPDPIF